MLIHFVILVLAFALMPVIPGIRLGGVGSAIIAALVFVVINFFLAGIVHLLLAALTLGLAFIAINFLTNLVLLWITDKLLSRFEVRGFVAHLLGAALLTVANSVANHLATGGYANVHRYRF